MNLAALYSAKDGSLTINSEKNVLITPGAIAANMNVLYTFLGQGDHVVCHYPTYQQLYEVPASLGADVSLWRAHEDKGWQLDIEELKGLIRTNTKMIIVKYIPLRLLYIRILRVYSNPQNPTGAIVPQRTLEALVKIAKSHDLLLHSDEVYRPLFHSLEGSLGPAPPSLLSLGYEKCIVSGSLSKAYSLAGIRVGWIASPSESIIKACMQARDYTNISVSQVDDHIAAYALDPKCMNVLLTRNMRLATRNLGILTKFVDDHQGRCSWTKPVAGTTAFIRFHKNGSPINDEQLCKEIHERFGVLSCPGSTCFGNKQDFKGYIRIGYCCDTEVLEAGLAAFRGFMKNGFCDIENVD